MKGGTSKKKERKKEKRKKKGGGSRGLNPATHSSDLPHTEVRVATWPKELEKPLVRGRGEWEATTVKGRRKFEGGHVLTFCIKNKNTV